MLTVQNIRDAFYALNEALSRKDIKAEITIYGGAYMVLALNSRKSTKDVDALFRPTSEIREAAKQVADDLDLPEDWLNDGVKGYLSSKKPTGTKLEDFSNLTIWIPEPEYILAMKAMSARFESKDASDLKDLIAYLKLKTKEDVFKIVENYYPKSIPVKTQYFIEELFED